MIKHIKKLIVFALIFLLIGWFAAPSFAATNYWTIPATVTRVTPSFMNQYIDARADGQTEILENINGTPTTYVPSAETYHPADRQWQGLPSMVKTGERLWAAWYTGGTGEPRQFNYIVIAYSDDNGESWVDPYIIVDHPDPEHDGVSNVVPNLFIDNEGNLNLIYIQYYTWIIEFHNAYADNVDDVTWDEPEIFTSSKIHKPPTYFIDEDGEEALIIASEAEVGDSHIDTTRFYVSKDDGETWVLRSSIESSVPNSRRWPESQITQAEDGHLITVSRIENGTAGGVEVTESYDYGFTWQPYENRLDKPYIGPGSKSHIITLSSGNILVINHQTTSSRSELYAYLSTDNGDTFPYELVIDSRTDVSYPYAYEENGMIYVTWDKGRYLQKEIRFAVFTEDDVIVGDYTSENAIQLGIVSKLSSEYKEIVSVNNAYETELTYEVGTPSASIRESLPTTFDVYDNEGNVYTLTGTWKNPGYYQDIAGTYTFYFQTSLPLNLEDTYSYLVIDVNLTETISSSNFTYLYIIGGTLILSASLIVYFVLKKKR